MELNINEMLLEAINKIENRDSKGYDILKDILLTSGCENGAIIFEIALFLLSQNMYSLSLYAFKKCHQLNFNKDEVAKIVLESFYSPNVSEFREMYKKNVTALANYKYFKPREFPDFSELSYRFLPYDDHVFFIYDQEEDRFVSYLDQNHMIKDVNMLQPKKVIIFRNEYKEKQMIACMEKTEDPYPVLTAKIPIYFYYDSFNEFVNYLQVVDFTKILEDERSVFLMGRDEADEWFSDSQVHLPDLVLNITGQDEFYKYIEGKLKRNINKINDLHELVYEYYNKLEKGILVERFRQHKLKIVFVTSRFTTALKYYIRDCAKACDKLGIENKVLIEKSDIHKITRSDYLELLNEFKPDLMFSIDHFRWEYGAIFHDNIAYISWVQDPMPHIMSSESAKKIKNMDFIMNAFFSCREFLSLGYPNEQLITAPMAVNADIYKFYELTEDERQKYSTDICVFSNAGNPLLGLQSFLDRCSGGDGFEILKKAVVSAYEEVYSRVMEGEFLQGIEPNREIVLRWLASFGITMDKLNFDYFMTMFMEEVVRRILRSVPLEWLHQKGYNMKLWGNEWVNHPVLKKYACGIAENGEVLSRIINASKIVIGTNQHISTHPRVFETILSNSFYLGPYIPEEYDSANIRMLLDEGNEIILYYNKEDLYEKVDYYLANPEKRQEIIDNGKKKIFQNLTYEALLSRVISEVADKIEKQM